MSKLWWLSAMKILLFIVIHMLLSLLILLIIFSKIWMIVYKCFNLSNDITLIASTEHSFLFLEYFYKTLYVNCFRITKCLSTFVAHFQYICLLYWQLTQYVIWRELELQICKDSSHPSTTLLDLRHLFGSNRSCFIHKYTHSRHKHRKTDCSADSNYYTPTSRSRPRRCGTKPPSRSNRL